MLAEQHEVEVAETSRRGHATRLARAAANDGFDVVAVLAGDGTLNEAADGLAAHATPRSRRCPGGSTNVYAAHARRTRSTRSAATSALLVVAAPARVHAAHRRRPGRTAGRSCSTPASASTPRSSAGSSATASSSGTRRTRCTSLAAFETCFRASTAQQAPLRHRARRPANDRRRLLRDRLEDRRRTHTSGACPLVVAPDAGPRHARCRSPRSDRSMRRHVARRRGVGDAAPASTSRTGARHRPASRPRASCTSYAARPFPYQVDGDDRRRHREPRHRRTSPTRSRSCLRR